MGRFISEVILMSTINIVINTVESIKDRIIVGATVGGILIKIGFSKEEATEKNILAAFEKHAQSLGEIADRAEELSSLVGRELSVNVEKKKVVNKDVE